MQIGDTSPTALSVCWAQSRLLFFFRRLLPSSGGRPTGRTCWFWAAKFRPVFASLPLLSDIALLLFLFCLFPFASTAILRLAHGLFSPVLAIPFSLFAFDAFSHFSREGVIFRFVFVSLTIARHGQRVNWPARPYVCTRSASLRDR